MGILDRFIEAERIKEKEKALQDNLKKVETLMRGRVKNHTSFHYKDLAAKKSLGICRSCKQGRMEQRQGKYGPFLGCSNYPNCTYTSRI